MKYIHGGDRYQNKGMLDFSANINPLGMPKGCMEAAMRGIRESVYYPDYAGRELVSKLARVEGTSSENILLGNGAAELIYAICYTLMPKKALLAVPCFQEYEEALKVVGCKCEYYPLKREKEYQLDEDFLSYITKETEVIFLCNPNNPTGKLVDKELLIRIAKRCLTCNTYLIVDECFLPFVRKQEELSMKSEIKDFWNVLILRAFTKIYAMPGLRLGYLLSANVEILHKIRKRMQPWNTSTPAQFAGLEALKDKEFLTETHRVIQKEREYLEENLVSPVIHFVYKGEANFIFFEAVEDFYERMKEKQILIRDCSNFPNLKKGDYRIAVRSHEENETFIKALHEVE